MAAVPVSWMDSKLGRGRAKNEPASARVNRREAEHIPKNARTFSASGENTIACRPVITL